MRMGGRMTAMCMLKERDMRELRGDTRMMRTRDKLSVKRGRAVASSRLASWISGEA
jgi:hypothetical protein